MEACRVGEGFADLCLPFVKVAVVRDVALVSSMGILLFTNLDSQNQFETASTDN